MIEIYKKSLGARATGQAHACMHADADALVMGCWCTLAACLSMQQEAGRHYCAQAGIIVHAGKQKQDPALLHAEQQAAWKGEVAWRGIHTHNTHHTGRCRGKGSEQRPLHAGACRRPSEGSSVLQLQFLLPCKPR